MRLSESGHKSGCGTFGNADRPPEGPLGAGSGHQPHFDPDDRMSWELIMQLSVFSKKVRPALGEAGRARTRSGDGEGWGRDRIRGARLFSRISATSPSR